MLPSWLVCNVLALSNASLNDTHQAPPPPPALGQVETISIAFFTSILLSACLCGCVLALDRVIHRGDTEDLRHIFC